MSIHSRDIPRIHCGSGQDVAVAMSGGVDSSVTAALLKKNGYTVAGFFMILAQPNVKSQIARVKEIADRLEIQLYIADFRDMFQREILDYFRKSYEIGKTPNPCMVCNRKIKFGKLREFAAEKGYKRVATGHYARIVTGADNHAHLYKGKDPKKDQTYFLGGLGKEQLQGVCFPLGELTKEAVYGLAKNLGLEGMHGEESQDVCFLQGKKISEYLGENLSLPQSPPCGEIRAVDGRILGEHKGVFHYTVGQRRGLGIPDKKPLYVVSLDAGHNRVIVGGDEDLYRDIMMVSDVHWIGLTPSFPCELEVKIRYRHPAAPGILSCEDPFGKKVQVTFSHPQRAITPGQFAVFYKGDEVIGSGEINCDQL